jgi:hypothetical protein
LFRCLISLSRRDLLFSIRLVMITCAYARKERECVCATETESVRKKAREREKRDRDTRNIREK